MHWPLLIFLLLAAVLVLVVMLLARPNFLTGGPRGEIRLTLLWRLVRVLARRLHNVRYEGLEHVPKTNESQPLIVVSNHTGGVDPLLIHAAIPMAIRWMMARDSMSSDFQWLWDWIDIIPVDRNGRDLRAAREALRVLRGGEAVGIFPEGGIENPPGEIRPFLDGVGRIVAKSKAPVLVVWVSGTPFRDSAFGSVFARSEARVAFLGLHDFSDVHDPKEITRQLRSIILDASGWPANDRVLPSARSDLTGEASDER